MSFKHHYQHFLKGHGDTLHMACHSHHFWPDVTRQAALDYWDDSSKLSDKKWNHLFAEKIPKLQSIIAKHLKLRDAQQIVFSPNTHDLVIRLLSTLDFKNKPRLLTTDGEFNSFSRQIKRLEEDGAIEVIRIPSFPSTTFWKDYETALSTSHFDMIFISHIFYNSGTCIGDLDKLVEMAKPHGRIIIDGYHSYFTRPINLEKIQNRAYFMAGHYKYAQAGEGLCFMTCPPSDERPIITGWFAEFEALSSVSGEVSYPSHAGKFLGSTMDFTPLYRALSVYELFEKEGITVEVIKDHIEKLQTYFLKILKETNIQKLNISHLITDPNQLQGQFLAFDLQSPENCHEMESALKKLGILTDSRGSVLRFGFSLYQDLKDLERVRLIKDL